MRRAPEFLLWKSKWWLVSGGRRDNVPNDLRSGLDGYAARQAAMFAGMAKQLVDQFRVVARQYSIEIPWSTELLQVIDGKVLTTESSTGTGTEIGEASPMRLVVPLPAAVCSGVVELSPTSDGGDELTDGSSEDDQINIGVDSDGYDSEF